MNEAERYEDLQDQRHEHEIKKKAADAQEKVVKSLNNAMSSAAEGLDVTANKIHDASKFFKEKNVDSIKEDIAGLIKKYPAQTLLGALFFGFIFGKVLSK